MTWIAFTRTPAPSIVNCELTHQERVPISYEKCVAEHSAYQQALADEGLEIVTLPDAPGFPDGVFVEDTAVVLDEIAVICRPGADSRMGEIEDTRKALAPHRQQISIASPGRLDGGDVLVIGKEIYIGTGGRSNQAAVDQFARAVAPFGYSVIGVPLERCLHLKTGISWLGGDAVLLNPEWVDATVFAKFRQFNVDASEPNAANVLRLGAKILCGDTHKRTNQGLRDAGFAVREVPHAELAKAEAGLTCCSIVLKKVSRSP